MNVFIVINFELTERETLPRENKYNFLTSLRPSDLGGIPVPLPLVQC